MNVRIVLVVATLLCVRVATATSQCPNEAKNHCGRNPFYVLAVSLAEVCTLAYPKHAADYKKQLEKFVINDPSNYAALGSDQKFLKEVEETKQALKSADPKELHEACTEFRTKLP